MVETMGLEPTTPCLQIRPTRTAANTDELLRLVMSMFRTPADGRGRLRALPFCYRAPSTTCLDAIRIADTASVIYRDGSLR